MTTTQPTGQIEATPREGMFRELLYIHALLRRDLRTVRQFADQVRDGGATDEVVAGIRDLETNSPLWRLKHGCMYYCRFVHQHHTLEDAALFPMVRKHDPSLNSVVDRLEEDHLTVHHITERIVAAADRAAVEQSDESRAGLVVALTELEEHLLSHLAFEEESLGPLLSQWDRWPVE